MGKQGNGKAWIASLHKGQKFMIGISAITYTGNDDRPMKISRHDGCMQPVQALQRGRQRDAHDLLITLGLVFIQ